MKKYSSSTLTTRSEPSENDFDSSTDEINYPDRGYQTFNTTFVNIFNGESIAEPFGYESGMISPVDDEGICTPGPKEASISTFKGLVSTGSWSSVATFNLNLDIDKIQKYSSSNSFGLKKDLRFSPIDKKYDLFYFDFSEIKKNDLPYCINNALASSRPSAVGFISGVGPDNFEQISSLGFSKSTSISNNEVLFIKKNDLSKISHVKITSPDGASKAEFLCDVAKNLEDKIAGLQPYKTLKYGSGLLFPYERPQDVTYHMGTVSFPIDIIFVQSSGKIKKIASNILPGTLGVFGASDVSLVIEISGGASKELGLNVGDSVYRNTVTSESIDNYNKLYGNFSSKDNFYVKNASFTRAISFGEFELIAVDANSNGTSRMIKSASINRSAPTKRELSVYNFDDILYSDYGKINNLSYSKFIRSNDNNLFFSKSASLSDFLAINSFTPPEVRKTFNMMKSDLALGKRVVIATKIYNDLGLLKSLIIKRASEEVIFNNNIHSVELISIPTGSINSHREDLMERFSASSISIKNISLEKKAGSLISDEVKAEASDCVEILSEVKDNLDEVLSSFKNNSEQYLKNKDKPDLIKGSRESYNISCKRISKKIVKMLLNVKKIIKKMNSVKDISSVDEKIESLSLSCKEFVDVAEGIFELETKIKESDFVDKLSSETSKIEKSAEDVDNNIKNFSDYILKNILNKKVLSR
jgi:uncharacterized membrane protein (UPF0127 family)